MNLCFGPIGVTGLFESIVGAAEDPLFERLIKLF